MSRPSLRRWPLIAALLATLVVACSAPGDEEPAAAGGDASPADSASETSEAASEPESATESESETESETAPESPPESASEAEPASTEPIRIGFLSPTTGTAAAPGTDMLNGFTFFFEANGTTFGGREVQTFTADDQGDPQVALQQAQRMVEEEQADIIIGPLLANTALAVADYLVDQDVLSIQPVASADDLTQRLADPLVLRLGGTTSSQPNHVAGQWAYDQGYRRAVTICPDYAFGHESCGGFARTFQEAGGELITQLWSPLGTQDFATYIAQLQEAAPDVIFATQTGGDAPRFLQAFNDFGLKGTIPLIGNATITEQAVLRGMGPYAEGIESFSYYAEGREAAGTADFVAAYEAQFDQIPSLYSAGSYTALQWITQAIEDGADPSDPEAFAEALRGIELADSPFGPESLDEYNNPVYTVYRRVVETDDQGRLVNVIQEEYPEVSQFFTYDPAEFLADPVYTRDYQGAPP